MIFLQNIGKYYYSETSVTQALRKINLEFHIGEFVAITGESGSGKSTLLNIISGMDTFDEGEMYFNGQPTFPFDESDWEDFRRNEIGFVFQDYNLIGHYSALDNVTSALLIMGISEQEAKKKARSYLEKVGLQGLENQRTSQLSSGQKQRLSIARALAKNTYIIVADEPTGNLDSETGEQIIALLKELSKDRLVLMVTHNYEQAAPYVTRNVRLHDGEVVVDVPVNEGCDTRKNSIGDTKKNSRDAIKKDSRLWKKHQRRIALSFARMNTRTQLGRSLLFRVFFLLTSLVSFIFIGELFQHADDTYTKDYDNTIYYQKNDSRLSVQRKDGKELTKKDREEIASVPNVVQVDSIDYVNDMNYYVEEGTDYVYHYVAEDEQTDMWFSDEGMNTRSTLADEKTPDFKNKKRFMRSASCLSKSDLSKGRLPKSSYEVVAPDNGKYKPGDNLKIYITYDNVWGTGEYYIHEFTVIGLTKEKDTQMYFQTEFCRMISAMTDGDAITMQFYFDKLSGYNLQDQFILVADDSIPEPSNSDIAVNPYTGEEAGTLFSGRVSKNYVVKSGVFENGTPVSLPVERAVPGDNLFTLSVNQNRQDTPDSLNELNEKSFYIRIAGEEKNFNSHSGNIMEVSPETFEKFYPRQSSQASVYIKNYTKTDRVIRSLKKKGYTAVSTYRISSVKYNPDKVTDRLIFLCISLGILLVMVPVEILILRSIMKIRIRDFFVMKSMGMQLPVIRKISFYEMTRYCVEALALTTGIMILLNLTGISLIHSMMIYYGVVTFATYVIYNLLLEFATVHSFNRLLEGRITK